MSSAQQAACAVCSRDADLQPVCLSIEDRACTLPHKAAHHVSKKLSVTCVSEQLTCLHPVSGTEDQDCL